MNMAKLAQCADGVSCITVGLPLLSLWEFSRDVRNGITPQHEDALNFWDLMGRSGW